MLLVLLGHLERWTQARRRNAERYRTALAGLAQVVLPQEAPGDRNVYHTFVAMAQDRDALRTYLTDRGIVTQIHYPTPIHLTEAARELGYHPGDFPVAERHARQIISLPIHESLGDAQIDLVCETVRSFYASRGTRR
jgi:dTDP-4-amino-4,6-dideoxygalactose transaminase